MKMAQIFKWVREKMKGTSKGEIPKVMYYSSKEEVVSTMRKLKKEKEKDMSKAIDCMAQHIKIFQKQSFYDEKASFGEPCHNCPYSKECDFDWLSIMAPLLIQSNIKISLAVQDLPDKRDNDDIRPVLDKDTDV